MVGVGLPEQVLSELKTLMIAPTLGRIVHVTVSRVLVGRGRAGFRAHVLTGVGVHAGIVVVVVLRHAVGAVGLVVVVRVRRVIGLTVGRGVVIAAIQIRAVVVGLTTAI